MLFSLLHMDRRAGGVNPALPDYFGLFRFLHFLLILSMFRNLFIFLDKREAHWIHPDPANLVCLVSRFLHNLLSRQWVPVHLMFLLPYYRLIPQR